MSERDQQLSTQERVDLERLHSAIELIQRVKKEHEGQDWSGQATCPVCMGVLNLVNDRARGFASGQCISERCLYWME
jgi:hypothetical protein